jgi:two-component system, NtrC family, sensor kinase
MSSLGKLAAAVVHEINNPIAGILNLVMLMKRIGDEQALGAAEIELFRRYLSLMETETRRTSQDRLQPARLLTPAHRGEDSVWTCRS